MKRFGFPSRRSARVTGKFLVMLAVFACMVLVGVWLSLKGDSASTAPSADESSASADQASEPGDFVRNGNFEADLVADPPTGWTTYIQPGRSGNWTIQTVTPPEGVQWQQTQVYGRDGWGGVRQDINGLVSGTVYAISGSYRTNSESATASVRYSLNGSTDRGEATFLAGTSSNSWETFSDTVTAIGGTITLFLDNNNGKFANKASAFDNIKVTRAQ